MEWTEIEVHSTNEAVEPIAHLLTERGANGVVIENSMDFFQERENKFGEIYALKPENLEERVVIKAYFPQIDDSFKKRKKLEADLRTLSKYDIPLGNFKFFVNKVNDENWATSWKKYYHPVKITENIVVSPIWEEYKACKNEIIIELDPGMAFGTGTHPTTQLCLQALSTYLKPGMEVIDVGTGSGILSIAAAKLGAKEVFATDLDEAAIKAASENITHNQVENKITIQQNNLLQDIQKKANIIIANILAEVILLFPRDVYCHLQPGGFFIASGIINSKSEQVCEAFIEAGFTLLKIEEKEGWVAITCKRGEE